MEKDFVMIEKDDKEESVKRSFRVVFRGKKVNDNNNDNDIKSNSSSFNNHEKNDNVKKQSTYECIICLEKVTESPKPVWNCSNCYLSSHAHCIRKWCQTQRNAGRKKYKQLLNRGVDSREIQDMVTVWPCPICKTKFYASPKTKTSCFCGKKQGDEYTTPSCGMLCYKPKDRNNAECNHACLEICHPGPCDKCHVKKPKVSCACNSVEIEPECHHKPSFIEKSLSDKCGKICNKKYSCGIHNCNKKCHRGKCGYCKGSNDVSCFCGKYFKNLKCGRGIILGKNDKGEIIQKFSCKSTCNKEKECGHICDQPCHAGTCESFQCKKFCGDEKDCSHICKSKCHYPRKCRLCELKVAVTCRCGKVTKNQYCGAHEEIKKDIENKTAIVVCKKKCGKWFSCSNQDHRCSNVCCGRDDHVCEELCGKKLNCGQHECKGKCGHLGKCRPCSKLLVGESVSCLCGKKQVDSNGKKYCGQIDVKKRTCSQKTHVCKRRMPCEHTCKKMGCHTPSECECFARINDQCVNEHQKISVKCKGTDKQILTCEVRCNKLLPCSLHKCKKKCHSGLCWKQDVKIEEEEQKEGVVVDEKEDIVENEGEEVQEVQEVTKISIQNLSRKKNIFSCDQVCSQVLACSHKCKQLCHAGRSCDDFLCKEKSLRLCQCGHMSGDVKECFELEGMPLLDCTASCTIYAAKINLENALSKTQYKNFTNCTEFCRYTRKCNPKFYDKFSRHVEHLAADEFTSQSTKSLYTKKKMEAARQFEMQLGVTFNMSNERMVLGKFYHDSIKEEGKTFFDLDDWPTHLSFVVEFKNEFGNHKDDAKFLQYLIKFVPGAYMGWVSSTMLIVCAGTEELKDKILDGFQVINKRPNNKKGDVEDVKDTYFLNVFEHLEEEGTNLDQEGEEDSDEEGNLEEKENNDQDDGWNEGGSQMYSTYHQTPLESPRFEIQQNNKFAMPNL